MTDPSVAWSNPSVLTPPVIPAIAGPPELCALGVTLGGEIVDPERLLLGVGLTTRPPRPLYTQAGVDRLRSRPSDDSTPSRHYLSTEAGWLLVCDLYDGIGIMVVDIVPQSQWMERP